MSTLNISVRMVIQNEAGGIAIPFEHSPKGSYVGDVSTTDISLRSQERLTNSMEIGSTLARIINVKMCNFSRGRDRFSVDIAEAYHNETPVLCFLEFLTTDGENEDTATLVISADKISNYFSHTKTNNPGGQLERIALVFTDEGASLKYGHKSMAVMALIKQMQLVEAEKAIAIGAAKGVGGIIRNIKGFI